MHTSSASEKLREQAADWVIRLEAADCPQADRDAFLDWLADDERHADAFSEAQRMWHELDALDTSLLAPVAAPTQAVGSRRRRWLQAVAATLVLGLGAGLLLRNDLEVRLVADARTGVGETRTLELEDGSRIQLDTASAVEVRYGADAREIELLAGEAAFEVAHDSRRPFRVISKGGSTTAVGTVFLVRQEEHGARVIVSEGRVRVRRGDAETELGAGQQLHYDQAGLQLPATDVDTYAASAWRRGRLNFVDRPLGEVVQELNRYRHGLIVIGDADLAALPVSGVFETANPLAAVNALELSLGLHSDRYTDQLIVLRR